MSKLIVDNNMLAYLHDLLSLRVKNEQFYVLDVYEVLSEKGLTTLLLGLRKTFLIVTTFFFILRGFQNFGPGSNNIILTGLMVLVSIIYGTLFLISKNEVSQLVYQFKLKKASIYALQTYNYESFVIFLDKYLSEQSTEKYYQSIAF